MGIPEGYEEVASDPYTEDSSQRARRQSVAPPVTEFGMGVNKGITGVLGFPGDLMDMALGTDRFGSKALRRGLDSLGVGSEPRPNSTAGYVGEAVGGNVMATGALLNAVRQGVTFSGPFTKYFKEIADYVKTFPLKSTLVQLGISGPQGVGAQLGEEVGQRTGMPSTGRFIGEVGGGALPLGVAAPMKWVSSKVSEALNLTQESARLKAKGLMEGSMSQPDRTTGQLSGNTPTGEIPGTPQYGKPTTGELTNDPGLMAQQRDLARRSEVARGRSQDYVAGQQESLRSGLGKLPGSYATPEDKGAATALFRKSIEKAAEDADREINAALQRAKAASVKPDMTPDAVSVVANKHLRSALNRSEAAEDRLWGNIGSPTFDTTGIKEAARQILANHPKTSNPSDVHPVIYQIAGEKDVNKVPTGLFDEYGTVLTREQITEKSLLNDRETFSNIQGLASRLKKSIRLENANGNFERSKYMKELLNALPDNTKPMTTDVGALQRWEMARAYTKSQNDVFTRGPIGQVMGYESTGETRVPAELILERLLRPGIEGKLGYRALQTSGGEQFGNNLPEVQQTAQQYMLAKFAAKTIDPTGKFNPQTALNFVQQHPVLDEMPAVKAAMMNSREAEMLARSVETSTRQRAERIANQGVAADYTRGEPAAQTASILRSENPTTTAKELMTRAKADPSGQAVKGIQGSFYEVMMARIAPDATKDLPVNGMSAINSKKLRAFINDYQGPITQVWGVDGLNLLKEVSKGADMGARIARGVAAGGGSATAEHSASLLKHVIGSLGSLIGQKLFLGSHPLAAAGAGSRGATAMASRFINAKEENVMAVLEQALYDPVFARSLLTHGKSPNADRLIRYGVVQDLGVSALQSVPTQ